MSYLGFAPFTAKVTVQAGQTAHVDAVMKVATASEQVLVTAKRGRGEVEAINRTIESDNILQVLPVEVITSLPNTNIADALGRLPSVTLERDEGEGKICADPRAGAAAGQCHDRRRECSFNLCSVREESTVIILP